MKQCGYLWAQGLSVWKKWKKRFFILVQVGLNFYGFNFLFFSFYNKFVAGFCYD